VIKNNLSFPRATEACLDGLLDLVRRFADLRDDFVRILIDNVPLCSLRCLSMLSSLSLYARLIDVLQLLELAVYTVRSKKATNPSLEGEKSRHLYEQLVLETLPEMRGYTIGVGSRNEVRSFF